MKKSLYDLLELSQTASHEAVVAAYQRLSKVVCGSDPDSVNRRKLLEDAYATLSQPVLRKRYDASLALSTATIEADSGGGISIIKLLVIVLLIAACGFGYAKYSRDKENARLERERIAAEERIAALRLEEERAQLQAEREKRQEALQIEQRQRYESELVRREAAQHARNQAYAAQQQESQQQRERRDFDTRQRQEQLEAQRRLEREKSYLRQLEAENSRNRRFSVR